MFFLWQSWNSTSIKQLPIPVPCLTTTILTFCLHDVNYFRYFTEVEVHTICPFVVGLIHWASCLKVPEILTSLVFWDGLRVAQADLKLQGSNNSPISASQVVVSTSCATMSGFNFLFFESEQHSIVCIYHICFTTHPSEDVWAAPSSWQFWTRLPRT
jgi:hypothetical protein